MAEGCLGSWAGHSVSHRAVTNFVISDQRLYSAVFLFFLIGPNETLAPLGRERIPWRTWTCRVENACAQYMFFIIMGVILRLLCMLAWLLYLLGEITNRSRNCYHTHHGVVTCMEELVLWPFFSFVKAHFFLTSMAAHHCIILNIFPFPCA